MKSAVTQLICIVLISVHGFELPGFCNSTQYYDPSTMTCQSCPVNASMITSSDGFACVCEEHSIPTGIGQCKPCNATEVVSSDGRACVSRRCQTLAGRTVCRKCPSDYISVTQNFDGSPTKELLCVKCARGYKAQDNVCVHCAGCACARNDIVVRGRCVPKRYVNERPKYEETRLHPVALLDIVKHEFLCTQNDLRACRILASECVRNFYTSDLPGPCRLWIQPKIVQPKGLPQLTIIDSRDKSPGEISLKRGMDTIVLAVATYMSSGGFKVVLKPDQKINQCQLPIQIRIGNDFLLNCQMNISELDSTLNETFAPFLYVHEELIPLPVSLRMPNNQNVQKGAWSSSRFRRYFLTDNILSITTNATITVYLRTFLLRVRVQRDKLKTGSLHLRISVEAHYAMKSPLSPSIMTTLRVEHEMPSAGVLRGLEIWGGVLGALLSLYAIAQWRGAMRRGGLQISLIPLLAGSLSDALYFAALFSTLHALAAEAGTLGMTLPLSHSEEQMIKAFVYSAVVLKAVKVFWINWNQCRCDIFFLDWSEYNPSLKENALPDKSNNWKAATLAREWSLMQTTRRASPILTIALALIVLHLMAPWQSYLPQSKGYRWAVATLAWLSSYITALSAPWVISRILGSPTVVLPKICAGVGLSLLVFQEEYYAHYVHGRNDDTDGRSLSGPLVTCRVVCAPQLRAVFKQLSTPGLVQGSMGESDSKQTLLSRFLAAFFERALDGLSWVASERTVLERLLDVELTARETGNTSALLYDPNDDTPSCFVMTWWGEEWSLGTFDALLFGCVVIAVEDSLLSALVTATVWQIMKQFRTSFGNKNQREKTEVDTKFS